MVAVGTLRTVNGPSPYAWLVPELRSTSIGVPGDRPCAAGVVTVMVDGVEPLLLIDESGMLAPVNAAAFLSTLSYWLSG